jgi:hypothetical protein
MRPISNPSLKRDASEARSDRSNGAVRVLCRSRAHAEVLCNDSISRNFAKVAVILGEVGGVLDYDSRQ